MDGRVPGSTCEVDGVALEGMWEEREVSTGLGTYISLRRERGYTYKKDLGS